MSDLEAKFSSLSVSNKKPRQARGNRNRSDQQKHWVAKANETANVAVPVTSAAAEPDRGVKVSDSSVQTEEAQKSQERNQQKKTQQPNKPRQRIVDKNSNNRKKNTKCFDPDHAAPDMRVIVGAPNSKFNRAYRSHDVVMVPELFCKSTDLSIYDRLLSELKATGKEKEGLWAKWHGDTHVIANDAMQWKHLCPTFQQIVDQMCSYFDLDVKATRLNWYRTSEEWKPYHHDAAAIKPEIAKIQNVTLAASFGSEREISFQHAKRNTTIAFPQPNGACYAFGSDVNVEWRHGVLQLPPEQQHNDGRISIICWGWCNEIKEQ